MNDDDDPYLTALEDVLEKINNANSNFAGPNAPWAYNYEFEDMINELYAERGR